MKKYNCIFPGLYNYILTKDVGMIPYILAKYYNCTITTYNNDNYTYIDTILKNNNLKINYLNNTKNEKKDVMEYIKKNAKNIDIIQFYHLRYNVLPWYVLIYKLYNPHGKIYLKLDANNDYIDFLVKRKGILPMIRRFLVKILFKFINVISIETRRNYNTLKTSNIISPKKLLYLPNGIMKNNTNINNKEKIILYVGYIEKKNKSIDMLLQVITTINLEEWRLVLIGRVMDDMKEFINNLFENKPELKDKIILKGYISDKNLLSQEYAKSSIYCCTSKKESFGISTLEAAYHGNYIISTNVGGSPDIINKTSYGKIINHDTNDLKETLEYTTNNWNKLKRNPSEIQKIVYDNFNWNDLCDKLVKKF
ncbi:glycosyltransferase [Methanosphaera stadtmanae]|uniref:glycosyltransferase n=1 Tax=Methanosphaera stadtmanae TaxID=2317 RepID=UPI002E799F5C|nr:glycosyltransferase [Methanosphaera stadtmanae]MEE0489275.1 glycosyltransferase [Methanosphaera stadtmanae]